MAGYLYRYLPKVCDMKSLQLMALATLSLLHTADVTAGLRTPGKYCGVVVYDRWDGCTLYSGIYVMYISEGVKEEFRDHTGKPVLINATKVFQPGNPGDGLISAFNHLGSAPQAQSHRSTSDIELRTSAVFPTGQHPSFDITVRNRGKRLIEVDSREIAPTLLRKSDTQRGAFPADGPSSALITRQSFYSIDEPRSSGQGSAGQFRWSWRIDHDLPRTFMLKPGAERRIRMTFAVPPGEYDFLAGYGGGVHSETAVASNLLAFDIATDGKPHLIQVEGR